MMAEKSEIDENTPFTGLDWQRRVPLFDRSSSATCGTPSEVVGQDNAQKLSRDAEDMLIRAKREPLTMTALYKKLGLSGYKGQKSKQELVRSGCAVEVELPANRRGRRRKLLQVTPKGTEYLARLGITQGAKGRGGVKHLYYQKKLKDWYETRRYTVEIEARIGNDSLDLLVICKDGSRLGIEIALSEQYEAVNAVKALGAGVERLLFVGESKALMDRLRRKIEPLVQGSSHMKVGYKLVSDYLGEEQK